MLAVKLRQLGGIGGHYRQVFREFRLLGYVVFVCQSCRMKAVSVLFSQSAVNLPPACVIVPTSATLGR